MTNKLHVLLCLLLAGWISSCAPEERVAREGHSSATVTRKSLDDVLQIPAFNAAYRKLAHTNAIILSSEVARTALEEQHDFTIVEHAPVKVVTNTDGTVSYVMLITRLVTEHLKLENLVISVAGPDIRAFIMKYDLDRKPILVEGHQAYEVKIVRSTVEALEIDGKKAFTDCFTISTDMCCDRGPNGTWPPIHEAEATCYAGSNCMFSFVTEYCISDGGGGGDGGDSTIGVPIVNTGGGGGGGAGGPVQGPVISVVTLEEAEQLGDGVGDPCDELKKLTTTRHATPNPHVNNTTTQYPNIAISTLKGKLDENFEFGFSFRNQGNFPSYGPTAQEVPHGGDSHVNFPPFGSQYGTGHTHPDDGVAIPMFSHDDIYTLLSVKNTYQLNALNPAGNDLFVCLMVVKQGSEVHTYSIKIDDISKLQTLQGKHDNKSLWDKYGVKLQERYEDFAQGVNGSATQYQREFLKFVKEQDLGVSLFEMETIGEGTPLIMNKWKKLTLSSDESTVVPTPCE